MSNQTTEGVYAVKSLACDLSLKHRCEQSIQSGKVDKIANRINVAVPQKRDGVERKAHIPEAILKRQEEERAKKAELTAEYKAVGLLDQDAIKKAVQQEVKEQRPVPTTIHDMEEAYTGLGRFSYDRREYLDLKEEDWKFDVMPEIMDGHNVLDFYDEDIMERLAALEEEEEELQRAFEESGIELQLEQDELTEEQYILLQKIRNKKATMKEQSRLRTGHKIGSNYGLARKYRPKTMEEAKAHLESMGLETDKFEQMVPIDEEVRERRRREEARREQKAQRNANGKRTRASAGLTEDNNMDDKVAGDDDFDLHRAKYALNPALRQSDNLVQLARMADHPSRTVSQSMMRNAAPRPGEGYKDAGMKKKAEQLEKHTMETSYRICTCW
eukprot:UN04087